MVSQVLSMPLALDVSSQVRVDVGDVVREGNEWAMLVSLSAEREVLGPVYLVLEGNGPCGSSAAPVCVNPQGVSLGNQYYRRVVGGSGRLGDRAQVMLKFKARYWDYASGRWQETPPPAFVPRVVAGPGRI
ncbi:MAG TPA: hypothetical protein VK968_01175 [Roseimicrobium sp.]|nr:hypothetical protein [Roseimicrobium sp.]